MTCCCKWLPTVTDLDEFIPVSSKNSKMFLIIVLFSWHFCTQCRSSLTRLFYCCRKSEFWHSLRHLRLECLNLCYNLGTGSFALMGRGDGVDVGWKEGTAKGTVFIFSISRGWHLITPKHMKCTWNTQIWISVANLIFRIFSVTLMSQLAMCFVIECIKPIFVKKRLTWYSDCFHC